MNYAGDSPVRSPDLKPQHFTNSISTDNSIQQKTKEFNRKLPDSTES